MKKIKNFRKQILLLLVCALSIPAFSQGIAIYKKDGTMIKCSYEEIDSIVAYNYGETPEIPDTPVTPPAETQYEAVDLGLPSGIKWATCNVGATKPEEYGGYYAWGETEEKDDYSWSTYKWCNGSSTTMTKYCTNSFYGTIDNKTVLDPEDDVAHVKWGGSWRMPTKAETGELCNNCTWTEIIQNGVNGYKVTGPNGNSIFIPAAGSSFWSSSLCNGDINYDMNSAYVFFFSEYGCGYGGGYYRNYGNSVRPVCGEWRKYTVTVSSAGNGNVAIKDIDGITAEFNVGSTVTVIATPADGYLFEGWFVDGSKVSHVAEYTFTVSNDNALVARFVQTVNYNGHEYVDLGLPSGLKWATCNVGATKPEEYGGYYAWGETEEKENYDWSTYKWCNGSYNTMTKYCTSSSCGTVDYKTVLDPEDDVAQVKWGGRWRMPTLDELKELKNNCTWIWTTQNGVNGYKVTSKTNGNSIFLPAAGYRSGTDLFDSGSVGCYWSGSLYSSSELAYILCFMSGYYNCEFSYRNCGHCVRPVSE